MVKAVGTDSGTKSMDLFGFDGESEEIFLDKAISREEITENPNLVIDELEKVQERQGRIDCIVASSGYGIPLKKARNASAEEVRLATFVTENDLKRRLKIVGLRELMMEMRKTDDLNIYFTPGVVQLPTVPEHRKANKIDLGTSDKVYTVILAIKDQSERLGIDYEETSLVAVEVGFAYTSALAVENGQIVDAMAGTAGFPGYLGLGFMDSELAYALGNTCENLSKDSIFQGGSAYVSGLNPYEVEIGEFVESGGEGGGNVGYEMMLEAILKDVVSLFPATKPREIILSGRFTGLPKFVEDVRKKFQEFFEDVGWGPAIVNLRHRGEECKEAAEGAALMANGIAGGKYKKIVENMRVEESRGKIFDHVHLAEGYRRKLDSLGG
ncbi:hypothetical protein AKJ57_02160 [candidate division MSBL1 archaeon SCGC-AAA259A05]|uniref:Butyrate kinase n=1 Tax=candidate division MSBL1 archaeon SCGC-AAA259A05 TaxID=1698259 RepID=A0A133UAF1_9EURY|nr:hypothetical protein AKJ57_02160 [candidate division MSBL1 archaeon SCGC-AAA259A05]